MELRPEALAPPRRLLSLDLLAVLRGTMIRNTLKCNLPSISANVIVPESPQKFSETITAERPFAKVLRLLDTDGNGSLSADEKQRARIVLYGHSWGAAETLVFARELDGKGIPVLLTIQVDSVAKPGRDDSTVPPNVAQAINLYQSRGPIHGRAQILAADPGRTTIIGNFHLTYQDASINCDNYPWYARTFNRPHHEIENDPRVWNLAASLIQSEFTGTGPT